MQRYAVIGSPVAHSLSPVMQQAAFDALGLDARYEPIDARDAAAIFARLRKDKYQGWNVTTPLKEDALPQIDRASDFATVVSAVNAVRREDDGSISGANFDGSGLVAALKDLWGWEARGARVLVLGSGPAARAIARALIDAKVGQLFSWARNSARSRAVAPPPHGTVDLVVSALAAGAVVPESLAGCATSETLVFDVNYRAPRSPVANFCCSRRSDGLPMLLHQGILSFEWWTGRAAPRDAMRAALARAVTDGSI